MVGIFFCNIFSLGPVLVSMLSSLDKFLVWAGAVWNTRLQVTPQAAFSCQLIQSDGELVHGQNEINAAHIF